jgi:hypothetical protein
VSPDETCAVCGRTILAGEQVRAYRSPDGPRAVCELCCARAERLGWRSEEDGRADEPFDTASGASAIGRLASVLRRRPRRPTPEPAAPDAPEPSRDPAAPGRRTERAAPEPFAASPFERAVQRFNASQAARTVAGLARTLGNPWVSVGASAGSPSEIRVTVAWELSWYQWGIDLSDELRPVFELDKGLELDQLDAAARQWNASTLADGRIALAAPRQGSATDGEPVGR